MTYTRKVMWECEREYATREEAENDEDALLKDSCPSNFDNAELYSNELTDNEDDILEVSGEGYGDSPDERANPVKQGSEVKK